MIYVYDSRKKTIREQDSDEEIELTMFEGRLIEILSNRSENSWTDIINYVYEKEYKNRSRSNINTLKCTLSKKVKLDIITKIGYGLILRDTIYIR